jgi:hypothetical protein
VLLNAATQEKRNVNTSLIHQFKKMLTCFAFDILDRVACGPKTAVSSSMNSFGASLVAIPIVHPLPIVHCSATVAEITKNCISNQIAAKSPLGEVLS